MRQLTRVDPELLTTFVADDPMIPILRDTMAMIRKRSAERYGSRPMGGSTLPRKEVIEGPDGAVDLYIFEGPEQPGGGAKPCLIWLHGGGYIMGHGEDTWNGPLFAEGANCTVISVDYRLAPEHPYPAGMLDSFAALKWAHDNADHLNIDPNRIAVGGASAGGGLAAGLCLHNRDNGNLPICFQLLLYPMIDNPHDTASGQAVDHPVWCRADSLSAWEMYLNGTPRAEAPAGAAAARAVDLSGLPPAFIPVGDVDLFHDEDRDYAARLNAAGVPAEFRSYPGMFHAGEVAGVNTVIGGQMLRDYVAALKTAFHG